MPIEELKRQLDEHTAGKKRIQEADKLIIQKLKKEHPILHINPKMEKKGPGIVLPLLLVLFIILSLVGIIIILSIILPDVVVKNIIQKEIVYQNNTNHIVPIFTNVTNNITIKEAPGINQGTVDQMNRIIKKRSEK